MALINCSECGQHISDKAPTCPKCGAPNNKPAEETPKSESPFSPPSDSEIKERATPNPVNKKKGSPLKPLIIIGSIIIIGVIGFIVMNQINRNNQSYESASPEQFQELIEAKQKTPEELRQELLVKEQGSPIEYLSHDGTWRINLLGEIVLEGTISNSATLATFKDVELIVTFKTKTDTELGSKKITIYEYIPAGSSKRYKQKLFAPRETGGLSINVISANSE